MSKLLQMPPKDKYYEAWFQEYRERAKYERELIAEREREESVKFWRGVRNGIYRYRYSFHDWIRDVLDNQAWNIVLLSDNLFAVV